MCNLQAKGQNIKGQTVFGDIDAVADTHAEFSKYYQKRMEA
jgi:hypothetical protein